ncbi:hypothetical protein CVIRNUC_007300, partial [Coccomyxa viridis]
MNLQGQSPEVAHQFFDLWQDSIEAQIQRMLADHRPCHYATTDSSGEVVWVPKHTPCWFESSSGKLVVDLTSGAKWLPALRSAPAKLLRVSLGSAVGMEEAGRAPPAQLAFPRRQNWPHYPVLELDLSSVPKT